jgi:hypothetical protein
MGRFLLIFLLSLLIDVSLVLLAAAAQGSSRSPWTKKGFMSFYSTIFTVGLLGALLASAGNGCSV